jgi:hypothetical protein
MDGSVTHIRLDGAATSAMNLLTATDLYPELKGRSVTYVVHELLRRAPEYKAAVAQQASERHPRPGKR